VCRVHVGQAKHLASKSLADLTRLLPWAGASALQESKL
jgi:hypothetical protein